MKASKHLIIFLMVFVFVIGLGAYIYNQAEGWSLLNSIYFVVITITTIGYGDIAPVTEIGRVFTIFFSFFGIAMAFYVVSLIGTVVFKKYFKNLKWGIKKQGEELKEEIVKDVKKGVKEEIEEEFEEKLKKH
tara:strand:- start:15616 stop:16011 length:396 start_codon:yes stop_codon:yes gene_type:complete